MEQTGTIPNDPDSRRCCEWAYFSDVNEAQGYALVNTLRGAISMANFFLLASLVKLALEAAGCETDENESDDESNECTKKIYGFKPSSLITNIATIAGLLAAFLMPVVGAILDYTSYRKSTGIISVASLLIIQATQIGTTRHTWFVMAILQAVGGFVYYAMSLCQTAYLPDIGRIVGEVKMTDFASTFNNMQFGMQLMYLIVLSAIGIIFGLDSVFLANVSQGTVTAIAIPLAVFGWKLMPSVPAKDKLERGSNIFLAGFRKLFSTAKHVNQEYSGGIRWFFLATAFAEGGMNAFTSVVIVFMTEHLKCTTNQVNIAFLIVFVCILPGAKLGAFVSHKTNPKISWMIDFALHSVVTSIGTFVFTGPQRNMYIYPFGVVWGVLLGWFYAVETLIFSLSTPKGDEEASLTGFFVYCRAILTWAPPLLFSSMFEAGIGMNWGLLSIVAFILIALLCVQMMDPWSAVIETRKGTEAEDNGALEFTGELNSNVKLYDR